MYEIKSKTILTPQNGLNIYRGRTDELIMLRDVTGGDPMDIGIKYDAASLLEITLRKKRSRCMIIMGNLGDPYNILEEQLGITRKCLRIIETSDCGVVILTRSELIFRDMDVLHGINSKTKCVITVPISSVDKKIYQGIEGVRSEDPRRRLDMMERLVDEGFTVIAEYSPMIPYLNYRVDDIRAVIDAIAETGVKYIDFRGFKTTLKKSGLEYFKSEYKRRFPKQYVSYDEEYGDSTELKAQSIAECKDLIDEYADRYNLICDTDIIKELKRRYENKTEGEQLWITMN